MAIGDTWETINTYAFVAGETIITADYENDVVNNLEYLYTHPTNASNIYTASTGTDVTMAATTNDILTGVTLTFTPVQDKVMLLIHYVGVAGWLTTGDIDVGIKVNTGSISYVGQRTVRAQGLDTYALIMTTATITAGSSNTITFYVKNTSGTSRTLNAFKVTAIEMAN